MASSRDEKAFLDRKYQTLIHSAKRYFTVEVAENLFETVWQYLKTEVDDQYQLASLTRLKLREFADTFIGVGPGKDWWPLSEEFGQWQQTNISRSKLENYLIEVIAYVIVQHGIQKASVMWAASKDQAMLKPRKPKSSKPKTMPKPGLSKPLPVSTKSKERPSIYDVPSTPEPGQSDGEIPSDNMETVDGNYMFFSDVAEENSTHYRESPQAPALGILRESSSMPVPRSPKGKERADQPVTIELSEGEIDERIPQISNVTNKTKKSVSFSGPPKRKRHFSDYDLYLSDTSIELGSFHRDRLSTPAVNETPVKKAKTSYVSIAEPGSGKRGDGNKSPRKADVDPRTISPAQRYLTEFFSSQAEGQTSARRSPVSRNNSPTPSRPQPPPFVNQPIANPFTDDVPVLRPSITIPTPVSAPPPVPIVVMEVEKTTQIHDSEGLGDSATAPQNIMSSPPEEENCPSIPGLPARITTERSVTVEPIFQTLPVRSQSNSNSRDSHLPSPPLSDDIGSETLPLFDPIINVPYSLFQRSDLGHVPIPVSALAELPNLIMRYLDNGIDYNMKQANAPLRNRGKRKSRPRDDLACTTWSESEHESEDDEIDNKPPIMPEERQYCRTRARVLAHVRMDLDRRFREMCVPAPTSRPPKPGEGFDFWLNDGTDELEDIENLATSKPNTHVNDNPQADDTKVISIEQQTQESTFLPDIPHASSKTATVEPEFLPVDRAPTTTERGEDSQDTNSQNTTTARVMQAAARLREVSKQQRQKRKEAAIARRQRIGLGISGTLPSGIGGEGGQVDLCCI